ncbi:hypothetical protein DNHGIG_39890 [Collibacillus ludicampi]|uniref:Uncharacterized protein n=1 Tax=Collibacillus ludicampi TaxID=2771369 RepID=A0AAV4LKM6_9BACL|nr:hypothetical protein [Collibacillus ludicampi]GIM48440.1 hypothetical protein DNHGIG_39890 [Collibacillus ludicampi]
MSETWEELFGPYEGRYIILDLITTKISLMNVVEFATRISYDSHTFMVELRNGGKIHFPTTIEPYIDEDDRLVCVNEDGDSLYIIPSPVQPV